MKNAPIGKMEVNGDGMGKDEVALEIVYWNIPVAPIRLARFSGVYRPAS